MNLLHHFLSLKNGSLFHSVLNQCSLKSVSFMWCSNLLQQNKNTPPISLSFSLLVSQRERKRNPPSSIWPDHKSWQKGKEIIEEEKAFVSFIVISSGFHISIQVWDRNWVWVNKTANKDGSCWVLVFVPVGSGSSFLPSYSWFLYSG